MEVTTSFLSIVKADASSGVSITFFSLSGNMGMANSLYHLLIAHIKTNPGDFLKVFLI